MYGCGRRLWCCQVLLVLVGIISGCGVVEDVTGKSSGDNDKSKAPLDQKIDSEKTTQEQIADLKFLEIDQEQMMSQLRGVLLYRQRYTFNQTFLTQVPYYNCEQEVVKENGITKVEDLYEGKAEIDTTGCLRAQYEQVKQTRIENQPDIEYEIKDLDGLFFIEAGMNCPGARTCPSSRSRRIRVSAAVMRESAKRTFG